MRYPGKLVAAAAVLGAVAGAYATQQMAKSGMMGMGNTSKTNTGNNMNQPHTTTDNPNYGYMGNTTSTAANNYTAAANNTTHNTNMHTTANNAAYTTTMHATPNNTVQTKNSTGYTTATVNTTSGNQPATSVKIEKDKNTDTNMRIDIR